MAVRRVPAGWLYGPDLEPGPGYADAFEADVAPDDPRTALAFARDALEGAPRLLRLVVLGAQKGVLRLRLEPGCPDRVLGWQVLSSSVEEVLLGAESPYLQARVSGSRRQPDRVRVTTHVHYRRPVARVLWLLVGPLHRVVARYLLARAARPR